MKESNIQDTFYNYYLYVNECEKTKQISDIEKRKHEQEKTNNRMKWKQN